MIHFFKILDFHDYKIPEKAFSFYNFAGHFKEEPCSIKI